MWPKNELNYLTAEKNKEMYIEFVCNLLSLSVYRAGGED